MKKKTRLYFRIIAGVSILLTALMSLLFFYNTLVKQGTENIWLIFASALPYAALVCILVFILILWLSSKLTKKLIAPIEDSIDNTENGAVQSPYEELEPFFNALNKSIKEKEDRINEVWYQKGQIDFIIENMPDGLFVLDNDRQILMVNNSAKQYLKTPTTNLIGKNFKYLSRIKELDSCVSNAFNGKHCSFDVLNDKTWLRFSCSPVYSGREVTGILCFIFDITTEKENDIIRQEFSANVTHELKTPLTTIRGYAELLENDMVKPEDQKRFAHTIGRESIKLLSIITDILELSKLESKYKKDMDQICSLKEVVLDTKKELEYPAQEKNISFEVSFAEDLPYEVIGNKEQLSQLIFNLCDNAIRYNEDGGSVSVELLNKNNSTLLIVKDTGIGIPEENLLRIYERFYTVDKSRAKTSGGTGLGLAIVKHVAENHQAKIDISHNTPRGSIFTVTFTN